MKAPTLSALALMCLVVAPTKVANGQGADLPYSSGSTGADGPFRIPEPMAARQGAAGAFDAARGEIVLFGGSGNRNDTWVRSTGSWTAKTPANAPSGRSDHSMVYDPVRQEVILFGGQTNAGLSAETWKWDGTTWSQLSPAVKPPARYGASMTYDVAGQRILLFGGNSGNAALNDMWLWNGTNWAQSTPAALPPARYQAGMAYNGATQQVFLFGGRPVPSQALSDTWTWNGTTWSQIVTPGPPYGISRLVYDPAAQDLLLFNAGSGSIYIFTAGGWNALGSSTLPVNADNYGLAVYDSVRQVTVLNAQGVTGIWNGGTWTAETDHDFWFDMTSRPSGVWNFTQIVIPSTAVVRFRKNAANTPVTWLASGHVSIVGTIALDGQQGLPHGHSTAGGLGGPGGFPGGKGGTLIVGETGPWPGTPGDGPGGGAGGTSPTPDSPRGGNGTHRTTYGNVFLQPLTGGSGGGGSAGMNNNNSFSEHGSSGGGGGGAILLASSRDISVIGSITSYGGMQGSGATLYSGGIGAGGAVRLVADRVSGAGRIQVGDSGRIRLEALQHTFSGTTSVLPVKAPPTSDIVNPNGRLVVSQVAGSNVVQPPRGDTANPDVVFDSAAQITVTVTATDIPNGTPVKLRITAAGQVIDLPAAGQAAVTLAAGTATFFATVPKGRGTIQASASFTVPPPGL